MTRCTLAAFALLVSSQAQAADLRAGVAQVDITPDHPVRLAGFGFRRAESEGVTVRIAASALALDDGEPAVLIAADLCGVPASLTDELAKRLANTGVRRERLVLAVTHSHTTPMVAGYLPTLFGVPIPDDHRRNIERYTRDLLDRLEKVARTALADRRLARLSWGVGSVGFAKNRRTANGPTDHDMPLLAVRDSDGKLRAVWVTYACHCVTLSNNKLSGDWAGFAREAIQADHPGAVALVAVGCGADQNPTSGVTGDKTEVATLQGREIAREAKRLLGGFLAPVKGPIAAKTRRLDLPLADLPPRAAWEEKVKRNGPDSKSYAVGYHAGVQLAKLDRGEALATSVPYAVQTWTFGDDLALAFLPGEVVVDYALRLKRELDGRRLWVTAYANDVPCYIPSERVLKEGSYEGGGAMVYYDLPGPFKPGLEQPIIDAVKDLAGERFRARFDAAKVGTPPPSPQQSLAKLQTRPGFVADLVAAEPLVASPVAIDFGPDGAMWVAEMYDYPSGGTTGRVRRVTASRGDGPYDSATVVLDGIPFPTGVTVWRKGVLVCAAPDILYAEDTNGDGKADVVKKLYSGFGTHNFQGRVNSLEYGLDGWVYGSCGLFGGTITTHTGKTLALGDRDFRIKPDTGEIEPATGRTQQGRPRDDWGNWFGCDNSTIARHYAFADHDLRRNPHVAPPDPAVRLGPDKLFPASALQLFQLSGPPGQPTAACGLGVYRDDLLGRDLTGDLFCCEPVNQLVTRRQLTPAGITFRGRRAVGEESAEFLASPDPWFRPVQARNGPDGCLYVVDMARWVIEHPRWIPEADLAKLDARAGSALGRVYRIRPTDVPPRAVPGLDRLDAAGLVAALDSRNGWQRDLATQMLLWNDAKGAAPALANVATEGKRPEARLHALCTLDGLGRLDEPVVRLAMVDEHPGVRRHAARLAGDMVAKAPKLGSALDALAHDTDAKVRAQVAVALGNWRDRAVGSALVALATRSDPLPAPVVWGSVAPHNVAYVVEAMQSSFANRPVWSAVNTLIPVAIGYDEREWTPALLRAVAESRDTLKGTNPVQMEALAAACDALDRRGLTLEQWASVAVADAFRPLVAQARAVALNQELADRPRLSAAAVLNRDAGQRAADVAVLRQLLTPQHPGKLQVAAVDALARDPTGATADRLLAGWASYGPALRTHVLDLLLGRDGWQRRLLKAVEANEVPAGQIDATRRQRLLAHKDATVRARAEKLFAGATRPDRQALLAEYRDVLKLAGDQPRGKAVFAKHCATCHQLDGVGHAVGPDLAAVTTKTGDYLLQEILDPNRNVDSRYVEYRAATKGGKAVTGVLAAETAAGVTLRGPDGREEAVLRRDLEELADTGRSLMPEGMEKLMTRQELADVIGYLIRPTDGPK